MGDTVITTQRRPPSARLTVETVRFAALALMLLATSTAAARDAIVVKLPLPPRSDTVNASPTPASVRVAPVEKRQTASEAVSSSDSDSRAASARVLVPPPELERFQRLTVKRGQSLYLLFAEHDLQHSDLMQMLTAGEDIKRRLTRLRPGQIVYVNLGERRRIEHLLVGAGGDQPLLVTREENGFSVSDGMWLAESHRAKRTADSQREASDSKSVAATASAPALSTKHLTLASGQSLYQLFTEHQLSRVDLLAMLRSSRETRKRLSRVRPGQSLIVTHRDSEIESLRLDTPGPSDLLIERSNGRFVARNVNDEPPAPTGTSHASASVAAPAGAPTASSATQTGEAQPAITDATTMSSLPAPVVQHELEVKRGDSLSLVFDRLQIPAIEVAKLMAQPQGKALRRLRPGQVISLKLLADDRVLALETELDETRTLKALRGDDDSFRIVIEENPLERRIASASGIIEGSLFAAGQQAGLSDRVIMQLVEIFGWDVDFALDVRTGDRFSVIYEALFKDGELLRDGNIIAAEFVNRGRVIRGLRYTDATGASAYFSPDGLSMRKAFLRTPVKYSRISSRFSFARRHPVLNRIRAHKGVDYAAPRGTPIRAAGNGRVTFSGWRGGYGRVVVIQHGQVYSTLYGHMSRIHRRAAKGRRVRQGEVIGYVGKTGLATGPHLHYEFRVRGVHKDPLKVKLPKALPIEKKYRADFLRKAEAIVAELDLLSARSLAASRSDAEAVVESQ